MISDALQTAIETIERYLRDCPECYSQPPGLATRIRALCERMDDVRNDIDSGPARGLEDMARTAGK